MSAHDATGAAMPNRYRAPLHAVERLAESGTAKTRAAARATGNWTLLRCLDALAHEARQRQRKRT